MENKINRFIMVISKISILFLSILFLPACKKEKASSPSITSAPVTEISYITASSGGNITSENGASVTARGVCWSNSQDPTISDNKTSDGSGTGSFTSALTGLIPNTTYYLRAYATNNLGTGYGNSISFTTLANPIIFNPNLAYGSVSDIDGNTYRTIIIGTQEWMAENLKTTKFNNGTSIPNVTGNIEWYGLTTPGYCLYNNDAATFKYVYGALYNWYAVNTGNLCPADWHVPSDTEWSDLIKYIDPGSTPGASTESFVAGGKMKETGTVLWTSPNNNATNETGFTAIPSGARSTNVAFSQIGKSNYLWSSTEYDSDFSQLHVITNDVGFFYNIISDKEFGFSVRCIKN